MKNSGLFILFGATGDLTKRKLIPALFKLFEEEQIDNKNPIICVGRRELSKDQFISHLELGKFIPKYDQGKMEVFLKQLYYYSLDLSSTTKCSKSESCAVCGGFKEYIEMIENDHQSLGNRAFYLATPPSLFEEISEIIKSCKLMLGKGWKRIVFEKPFGKDLASARKLNKALSTRFKENQIYRIDHYLGKALVQDILVFRFSNVIFEQIWNNKFIDNIQITVAESVGIGDRSGYYDSAGAIRDMLQNHLMELFALVAMEMPHSFNADAIRDEKAKIIKKLIKPTENEVVTGQYGSGSLVGGEKAVGYKEEKNIKKSSRTETYVAIKAMVNNSRWRGVPFYLRTGKRLSNAFGEINIELKDVACRLFNQSSRKKITSNIIKIKIQPDTGISVFFNTKIPGQGMDITPVEMNFCHHCLFAINTPEAYEALFLGILNGDQTMFTRWDSVEASWKYVDQIMKLASIKRPALYKAGTVGPKRADQLLKNDKRAWINDSFC